MAARHAFCLPRLCCTLTAGAASLQAGKGGWLSNFMDICGSSRKGRSLTASLTLGGCYNATGQDWAQKYSLLQCSSVAGAYKLATLPTGRGSGGGLGCEHAVPVTDIFSCSCSCSQQLQPLQNLLLKGRIYIKNRSLGCLCKPPGKAVHIVSFWEHVRRSNEGGCRRHSASEERRS